VIRRLRNALIGLLLLLAACNGAGPVGNRLGTASVKVHVDANGSCDVELINGKDQTNLSVEDLQLCNGHLGKLHADKSDGAARPSRATRTSPSRPSTPSGEAWAGRPGAEAARPLSPASFARVSYGHHPSAAVRVAA
jgi:hypothetical protein